MLPVLVRFLIDSPLKQVVVLVLGAAITAYAFFSGWRGALVAQTQSKTGETTYTPAPANVRWTRALTHAAVALVLVGVGLHYALPPDSWLGQLLGARGEGIPVHTYGLMLASGFFGAVMLSAELAAREWRGAEGERKREQIYDLAFYVFIAGVGGAKLLFVLVGWKDYGPHLFEYLTHPSMLVDCLGGGLVFYGGLIGAAGAAYWYARTRKIDFLRLADLAIPTVSLGQCFGRLGCFSAGCCWGEIAGKGVRWAVQFPGATQARDLFGSVSGVASIVFQNTQMEEKRYVLESTRQVLNDAAPGAVRIADWVTQHGHTLPLHPTQLYESIGQLLVMSSLLVLRRYRRFHGQIFGIWLMAYALLRSTVELFRGDALRGTLHGLFGSLGFSSLADRFPLEAWYNISTSQFISLGMFAFGAYILYRRGRMPTLRAAVAVSAA